jgi:hypothetical protein
MAALAADVNNTAAKLDALRDAARAHNVELSIYRVTSGDEIAATVDRAHASGAAALNIFSSPLLWANRRLIIDRAIALHLPTMFDFPETQPEDRQGPRPLDPTTVAPRPRRRGDRMRRRDFLSLAGSAAVGWPVSARAQSYVAALRALVSSDPMPMRT